MSNRLPIPGSDNGTWGDILNAYLSVSLASDGTLNPNVVGTSQIQNNAITNAQLDVPTQTIIASVASKYVKPSGGIPLSDLSATGTASSSTYLRGDNTWSTPAAGVTLDSTATDIQALGTQSAGTTGKAADAGHVHPTTGLVLSSTLGAASGVATLNSSSQLTSSQLPSSVVNVSQQWFNVKTYGATGNGSTDDTVAIQAAITASTASGGGIVYFPAGVYLTQPLTLPPGTVLQGVNGQAYYNATTTVPNNNTLSELLLKTSSTGALISPNDGGSNLATAVRIHDLALNCNGINQPAINLPDQGSSISRFWIIDRVYAYNVNSANTASGFAVYVGNNNSAVTMRDCVIFNGTSGSPAGYNGLGWYGQDGRADNVFIGYFANTGLYYLGGTNDETLTWRGGGIFTCNIGVVLGGGGGVFEGTSIDHNQADGVYIGDGPAFFTDCTFHSNSLVGNGSNSNVNVAGNNLSVSLVNCRAAPNDGYPNNPKYMVYVGGTGCTLNLFGNTNEGTFTIGWTNYTGPGSSYNTPLASNTVLTADSAVHTLVTSGSLPVGTYLVTATLTIEGASSASAFIDFGLALGTAVGSIVGTAAGAMSEPAAADEYVCMTSTATCIVTITTAGTLILRYYCTGATTALSAGVNYHSFGSSTGITAVAITVAQ